MAGNNFISLNEFNGGVQTDLDNTRIGRNNMTYALNVECVSFDGNMGVATNRNGNKQIFALTADFKPLAWETIKGVTFILSYNPITQESEIGCFPAPDAYVNANVNQTGFTRQYSPLWNLCPANDQYTTTQASRTYFKTDNTFAEKGLNFYINHQPKVKLREDYDSTVNIYFVDGVNTDKVINSGFNIETGAVVKERTYGRNSFPCFVELINESHKHPKIDSPEIINGGKLKNGNYKFYVRYSSYDYNPTSYLAETGMFMVSDINFLDDKVSATGERPGYTTNKSVKFRCLDLDEAYKFIEVACVHYTGETYECLFFDKRFEIDSNGEASILISGNEANFNIDISQIITKKTKLKISSSITDLDERLFRSDLKTKYKPHNDLAAFASAIVGEDDYVAMYNPPFYSNEIADHATYKSWQYVYNYLGYFSCEAYPFGVVFVFNDGTESDSYPIKGTDFYNNTNPNLFNNNQGIIRFPDHSTRNQPIYDSTTSYSHAMGIKFDITQANLIFQGSQYLQNNVVGFYIVRGDRKKNLLYQGILLDIYTATKDKDIYKDEWLNTVMNTFYGFGVGADNQYAGTDLFAPFIPQTGSGLIHFDAPRIMYWTKSLNKSMWGLGHKNEISRADATPYSFLESIVKGPHSGEPWFRKALFSADHFFLKSLPKANYTIQPVGKLTALQTWPDDDFFFRDIQYSYFYQHAGYINASGLTNPLNAYNVNACQQTPWNTVPINGFVSMFNEGSFTDPTSFAAGSSSFELFLDTYKETMDASTFAMAFNSYIGLTFNLDIRNTGSVDGLNLHFGIANLFIQAPGEIDITNLIDPRNTNYYKVSPLIPINFNNTTDVYFNGDCFLGRVAQRVQQNPGKYPISKRDDNWSLKVLAGVYSYTNSKENYVSTGQVVEYVAEHQINHGMRLIDGNKTFYPASNDYTDYACNNVLPESDLYNPSFSATGSLMQYRGFNNDLPEIITEFTNRIMGSNNHILNGFKDGYRQFSLATYKDYNFGYGRIVDIQSCLGQMICIMEHHIGLVPVNERVQIGTSSGELAIGFGDLLPLKQVSLSQKFGCQQRLSIVNTGYAVYGWDWYLRKIWKVTPNSGIEFISDSLKFSSWVNNIIDGLTTSHSDIIEKGFNEPVNGNGICGGFDQKYGDVYWTIHSTAEGFQPETISISEKVGIFKGWHSFTPNMYLTLGEDFYTNNILNNSQFWLHDDETPNTKATFYGVSHPMIISFVVNDKVDLTKIFDNLIINSNPEEFQDVFYETLTQESDHGTPFIKTNPLERWVSPKYKNDNWAIPINRAKVIKTSTHGTNTVNSKLRGKWLKITLEFNQNIPIFIKSILTEYNISHH